MATRTRACRDTKARRRVTSSGICCSDIRRRRELLIDPFCGSGTTLDVARDLNRKALGYDVHPTRKDIFRVDAKKLPPELSGKVDLVFMDPPYGTHLDYGDDPRDIGKLDAGDPKYYDAMEQAFREAHRVLKAGKV